MPRDPRHSARWRDLSRRIAERDVTCRVLRDAMPCGRPAVLGDHIVPPHLGGAMWDPANLQGACAECNNRKGARERADYRPVPVPRHLTPRQFRIVAELDAARVPSEAGRRTARTVLTHPARSSDIDSACAYRRARADRPSRW
jgi:hypothetical protein